MDNKAQTFAKWLIMLLFAVPATLRAQTFGGGSGTITDPYIISTTDHFDQLAADVNNGNKYENVYFKLMADLDYSGKTYTPIGCVYIEGTQTIERRFCGNFLGNNHSINNVTINSEDSHCGLFGFLGYGGLIFELTLGGNSSITSIGHAGSIVGEAWSNTQIIGCHVGENVIISVHPVAAGSAYAPGNLGGIAGTSSGRISSCVSKATINNGGIAKTENLGGIVGRLNSLGEVELCRFLGTVDGTRHVGDVVGSSSGTVTGNYYHTSVRHGGVNGIDTDGAQWMGTVTFGEYVSGSVPSATYWDGSTPYFAAGKAMVMLNMNYNNNSPAGYIAEGLTYSANGVALVEDGSVYRFTMPDEDVTITGNATVKRDIGYSDWVTINIPSQIYSGHALTPVITVTDNMTGTPVTLVEGTDYSVTLPDGDCINYGDYPITITGIGTFGGQTTAVFSIVYSGSGTEEEPYLILTTDDMDGLASSVNGGNVMSGKHFRLMNNLDYSGKTYTPIGTMSSRFQGTFDGYGHSISNVVINQPDQDYQALFSVIGDNGTVMNLNLGVGSSITGGYYVGGIAGLCGGTITGCTVSEGVSISGNQNVGGIAGRIVGTLSDCVNNASVSGSNYVGGIAGASASSTISNNLNLGAVSIKNNTIGFKIPYQGGIVGYNISSTTYSNNYYAGACNVDGINAKDVKGKAMKGWIISNDENVFAQMFPIDDVEGTFVGITYDGIRYLGAGETTKLLIDRMDGAPAGDFAVTAGTLTPLDEEFYGRTDMFYMLTMPNSGQNVNIYINTATAIDHIPQTSENADGQWYTIDGRRLQGKPTKKGIYIHNGKKVIK